MISKYPNFNSEDDSLPTLDRRSCKFWNSLISARKHLKLSTTTTSSGLSSLIQRKNHNDTPIQFRYVSKFWKSIHKFARKHFKLSTITTRSDTSSTNPDIILERSDASSTNNNITIDSFPTLPFDVITEILSRLPVKLLLQLRCICKSWNSLISNDPNFAKKHHTNSTTHSICSLDFTDTGILIIYPPDFFFDTADYTNVKQLSSHSTKTNWAKDIVGSCNGILCLAYKQFILLWNPSIRKLKELPLLPNPDYLNTMAYGFGYDYVTDHYKVVVISWKGRGGDKTQVKVNTLGTTNIWKNIEEFPSGTVPYYKESGKYVNGTINWLASSQHYWSSPRFIVSLDLGNESYRKLLLPPDYVEVNANSFLALTLDVFRDCLCIISLHEHDIWLMKEYGKKESWTKLFTISYMQNPSLQFSLKKVIYVFEDGQMLLLMKMPSFRPQLIVYDPRIGTFKFVTSPECFKGSRSDILGVSKYGSLVVCIESLISPCS